MKKYISIHLIACLERFFDIIPKTDSDIAHIKKGGDGWNWSTVVDAMPIYGIQINLNAGSALPVHDHRGYIGLVYVMDGSVSIDSYCSDSSSNDDLVLTQVGSRTLISGESAFVTLESQNIHTIRDVAGGSTILDILTIFRGNGESYEIEIDDSPVGENVYHGVYTGREL